MLAYIPVRLDLFRNVRRHLHWTLQNLIAFADRTGRCFPSVRTLEKATGTPRSTVSRHLAQLAEDGSLAYALDHPGQKAERAELTLIRRAVTPARLLLA
jgi:hypothetical protein